MEQSLSIGRAAAACGVGAALLNLAAVAALQGVPHAYKPDNVSLWLNEILSAPGAATASAWAFTVGLALLVPFGAGLARRDAGTMAGAALLATGAVLDAAGTMAPLAALHVERPVGEGLLWMTLLLDSSFNALLALGLVGIGLGMRREAGWPRGLRALAFVAGLASLPVALQFASDTYARLLAISGPLWLAWVVWASVAIARKPGPGSAW